MQCIRLYFSVFLFITATAYGDTWNTFRGNPQLTGVAAIALPDNLHLLWTYTAQDAIESTAAIHENTVYVGSLDSQLYALDLITGSLKWQYQADGEIKSSPTVDDSTVYFGDEHGTFHAVDRQTGQPTDVGPSSSANGQIPSENVRLAYPPGNATPPGAPRSEQGPPRQRHSRSRRTRRCDLL